MMNIRTAALLLSISVSAPLFAEEPPKPPLHPLDPAGWSDAFSRREFKLGMSLKEFRAVPYPDKKEHPHAFLVCSDEPKASTNVHFFSLMMSSDWKAAGVVKCLFYENPGPPSFPKELGMIMGGIWSPTEFYFIRSAPKNKLRLFLVMSGGPTERYDDLVLTFAVALGKPKDVRTQRVKSKAGAEFENTITTWTNSSSMLVAARYDSDLTRLVVKHILNGLFDVFQANLEALRKEKAKQL